MAAARAGQPRRAAAADGRAGRLHRTPRRAFTPGGRGEDRPFNTIYPVLSFPGADRSGWRDKRSGEAPHCRPAPDGRGRHQHQQHRIRSMGRKSRF